MTSAKIIKIFKDELPRDLTNFEALIQKEEYKLVRDFAHKYKLRLYYLNYEACLLLCNQIIDAFKEEKYPDQINLAKELNANLATIKDNIDL